ncbi:MAG: PAQR family membrane homeostasis protein TrhA [Christensenellales bacterium]|jgi:hemolysin III
MKRTPLAERTLPNYTRGEEIFNMVSHTIGGTFAFFVILACAIVAAGRGNTWGVATGVVYGFSMLALYTMSSIYHGLHPTKAQTAKKVLQVIDHCTIYLLIAGTYTPVLLVSIRNSDPLLAWTMFGAIWAAAALGITLTAIDLKRFRVFSMACYIGTGWMIVAVLPRVLHILPRPAFALLLAGGIAYTLGAVFYGIGSKKKYMHCAFHVFVLLGSILHFICIINYVM